MTNEVKKAIFPIAGLGTRFLPFTKTIPKEMLPIVDKPLIQYAVEEAIAAGITELIFIISKTKKVIQKYFTPNLELERQLLQRKQYKSINKILDIIPKHIVYSFVYQPEPLGLGHAILMAEKLLGDEPFAILLADELLECTANKNCLFEMLVQYNEVKSSLVAVRNIIPQDTCYYGIVTTKKTTEKLAEIDNIIEKPVHVTTQSPLAVLGRYILTPVIITLLKKKNITTNSELQLADVITELSIIEKVYTYKFTGRSYDCGRKLGYLQALVAYGLAHDELGIEFAKIIDSYSNRVIKC